MNGTVGPPQKGTDDDIEDVRQRNKDPEDVAKQELWRHEKNGCGGIAVGQVFLECHRLGYVDRYDDRTANNGKYDEHVPAHAAESQKQSRIQANLLNIFVLVRLEHGPVPGEEALAHGRGSMLLICVAETWGVHGGVEGSEQQEDEEDGGGDSE